MSKQNDSTESCKESKLKFWIGVQFEGGPPLWSSSQSSWSRGQGSIPGATRFSKKWWAWNGVHSASWVQLRSYLEEKVAAQVYKTLIMAVGDLLRWLCDTLFIGNGWY
jgi:hypothetical protein